MNHGLDRLRLLQTQKTHEPTTVEGSEIGGSSFQVVVRGHTGQRTGPCHLSKLRAPVWPRSPAPNSRRGRLWQALAGTTTRMMPC